MDVGNFVFGEADLHFPRRARAVPEGERLGVVFDAVAVAITTIGNIGPAFGIVSATSTYAPLSDFSKAILCLTMLLGRLEIFTLLILLQPSFWRRTYRW